MKYTVLQNFELDGTKFLAGSTVEFAESIAQELLSSGKIGALGSKLEAPVAPTVDAEPAKTEETTGGDSASEESETEEKSAGTTETAPSETEPSVDDAPEI